MSGRTKHRTGDVLGRWTLVEHKRTGGNGDVWLVQAEAEPTVAVVKILHRTDPTEYERFRREVEILEGPGRDDPGILPILDSHLPEKPTARDRPWLSMPLATELLTGVTDFPLRRKVESIRDVAATLAPSNLDGWRERTVVGDFGLAKRPSDPDLSDDKIIGPFLHLPSEVYVDDEDADQELVDVHCLANTMWCVLAGRLHPPRGQIRVDEPDSLAILFQGEPAIASSPRSFKPRPLVGPRRGSRPAMPPRSSSLSST